MNNSSRIYRLFFLIAVPLIALAATGSILYLQNHAFTHLKAQTSLIHVDEKAGMLHASAWGSIAEKKFNRSYLVEAETLQNEMEQNINESLEMHIGEDMTARLSRSFDQYVSASNDVFRLLSEGNFETAGKVFRELCEPRYAELSANLHESIDFHDKYAERQAKYAYAGSLLVTLAAITLIIFLFHLFERQRRQAEISVTEKRAMRDSEERFRSVAQSATDAIISINSQDSITYWNRAAETIFGYKTGEVMGKPLTSIMPERFRDAHREGVKRVVETGKTNIIGTTIEVVGLKPDGREFPLEMSLSRWKSREGVSFTAICRDITGRKQVEEQLHDQRADLEAKNRELARLHQEARRLSLHDPLTGLANRRFMSVVMDRNLAAARRFKRPFSVMMLDIDFFKKYNDSLGHTAGDKLLINLSNVILTELREIDLVVRYGGEEFLILLPETGLSEAVETAERIRKKIQEMDFFHSEKEPPRHITVSLGVASYGDTTTSDVKLIAMADKAMYKAKSAGRNRVETAG